MLKHIVFVFLIAATVNTNCSFGQVLDKYVLTSFDTIVGLNGCRLYGEDARYYAEIDEINGWTHKSAQGIPYIRTKKDYVDELLSSCKLFILENIAVCDSLESVLLYVSPFDCSDSKRVFLINKRGESVISVLDVCEWSEYHCYKLRKYKGMYLYSYYSTTYKSKVGRYVRKLSVLKSFEMLPDGRIVDVSEPIDLFSDVGNDSLYVDHAIDEDFAEMIID